MKDFLRHCYSWSTGWLLYFAKNRDKRSDSLSTDGENETTEGDQGIKKLLGMLANLSTSERDIFAKKAALTPRPLSLAVIEREDGRILVDQGFDARKREAFYRLLGGGIDFGELSEAAVVREIYEELGFAVQTDKHLGTVENIFSFEGKTGHEIAFIYRASFVDKLAYHRTSFQVADTFRAPTVAVWKSLQEIKAENLNLYPHGVIALLSGER